MINKSKHLGISRNNPLINAKRNMALSLLKENRSFNEIGEIMGITATRARALVNEAELIIAHGESWVDGMSTWLAGMLISGGYNSLDDVLRAFQMVDPGRTELPNLAVWSTGYKAMLRMVGRKRIRELGVWIAESLSDPSGKAPTIENLQHRAAMNDGFRPPPQ
jgi:O-acetylhomoserine/O-acetylserine sulfhydrylase-like pyridoxal-dependent enzyme